MTSIQVIRGEWDPLEGHWGFPIEEEIPPEIHEPNSIHPQKNLAVNSPGRVNFAQRRLSDDQLQMIFDLRGAVEDQQFRQEIILRRMDALFDTLSGDPVSSICPTCRQPYAVVLEWREPPSNMDESNNSR